jgi:hypothetical protein
VGTLEGVKDHLEKSDLSLAERQKVFANEKKEVEG